ncbi:flagellar motor switch protein FliG [Marichromatium gracile]|uniref:Flagellar motor switch protein FliG n=1 Tax=Marichromatium bheemlicum TaxID=365339 RepID=A0ABX1I7H8_9GAMM|nr:MULTISPECIES: flagellar motor switch protein FliG [Marichromatium]MCF1184769.1 flagellar motor switch protein FliG [Marichromatium gracile]NKN33213.1 flagellar motor switch protein FliG [Marichromatium bheemlicum]
MATDPSKRPGPEQVAIFLMSIGEAPAAEVLKHMGPKEVQKIGTAMASLERVSRTDIDYVLKRFSETAMEHTSLGIGAEDYVRSVLNSALGEDKASGLIDRILLGRNSKGLEALKWLDPRAIAEMIRHEHPQIVAIVLSHLDADQAAETLSYLPDRMQSDIVLRIATLDGVQPAALHELDEILERQLSGKNTAKSSMVGGVKTAADILNFMDASQSTNVMSGVTQVDEDLGERIQELMFVFESLVDVDDRGIQTLLREISTDSLVLALKGADDALKDKIFKNMSKRAAEMLREDLEAKGPVRLSDVEGAQKEILAVARRLSESGDIVLGGAGGEQMV